MKKSLFLLKYFREDMDKDNQIRVHSRTDRRYINVPRSILNRLILEGKVNVRLGDDNASEEYFFSYHKNLRTPREIRILSRFNAISRWAIKVEGYGVLIGAISGVFLALSIPTDYTFILFIIGVSLLSISILLLWISDVPDYTDGVFIDNPDNDE